MALAMLVQSAFLAKLSTAANGVATHVVTSFVMLLQLVVVFAGVLTFLTDQRTEPANKFIFLRNLIGRFESLFGGSRRYTWLLDSSQAWYRIVRCSQVFNNGCWYFCLI